MLFRIRLFSNAQIEQFLISQQKLNFSYTEVEQTLSVEPVAGYDNDENVQILGEGSVVWEKACAALRSWRMFPGTWARIYPDHTPIEPGRNLALVARVWGIWWLNACRIIYVIDEPDRFGFAYGTLPGHAETGEELFVVERDATGVVQYRIKAFSRPRFWLVRLAYPVARAHQRKFVRDSKACMLKAARDV